MKGTHEENDSLCVTDEETGEGSEQSSNKDQDSDASFQEDDAEIDKSEKEEKKMEFIKRSTEEAEDQMNAQKPCWIETHRRIKWRMAMRIASLPQERWTTKIIEWNLGLDNKIRTNSSIGRPRKRWEDDISEFLRPEETEEGKGSDLRNNCTWKIHAKKHKE